MSITRRAVIIGTAITAVQCSSEAAPGPFKLPPLPYAANALEPHIDARTMEIHHDRHHAAYVNNLNTVAKDNPQIAARPIQQVLARLSALPAPIRTTVRNNLGGHANHSMFWEIMGPGGGQPSGALAAEITKDFGSLDGLQTRFNDAGTRVFGSG